LGLEVSPPTGESARLEEEAVGWLVRAQSDTATADDWVALTAWLEASEAHARAFAHVEALSAEISDNSGAIADAIATARGEMLAFKRPARRRPVWTRWAGLAAAAAVIAVVAAPALRRAYQGEPTTYRSAVGETREVDLGDGSRIRLDGASTMTVRLGWRTRRIDLAQAQASFDVAKDPRRPFLVDVGDQQVRVVGTEFNILHVDHEVVVSVRRGIVEVRQSGLGPDPVARLVRGDELRHAEGTQVSQQQRVNPDKAFAWASGRLVCDDEPLGQVVAELNRRYALPIRVTPAAAGKRFSGVLELGDQGVLVRRLAGYLSLSVRRTDREITLS
jgi:transmembrane sensor